MFAQHSLDTLDMTVSRMLEADGQEPTSTATASNQRKAVFEGRLFLPSVNSTKLKICFLSDFVSSERVSP